MYTQKQLHMTKSVSLSHTFVSDPICNGALNFSKKAFHKQCICHYISDKMRCLTDRKHEKISKQYCNYSTINPELKKYLEHIF